MQCRQKYNREGGESAEQEQVSNTRTPSPKGDAILDFPFFCPSLRRNAFWVYYCRAKLEAYCASWESGY